MMNMVPEHKHLFAAYLNMARQNVCITLSNICRQTGKEQGSEDNLAGMSPVRLLVNPEELPETVARTIQLLDKHFPFLKPMLNREMFPGKGTDKSQMALVATPGMYHKALTKVFGELNSQRNRYTHARHEGKPFDKDLIGYMKNCFDGAVRVAKERFNLQDRDVAHLNRFHEKTKMAYDKKGRGRRSYEENPAFHYKFDNDKGDITGMGLAFFTCLFLERKYANLLLSQIRGFEQSGQKGIDEGRRVAKTVFGIYRIRMPKPRIDSESSNMTLGIDMLNELKKCPAELFEHLEPEKQALFRIRPGESQFGDEWDEEGATLMKRFENRFPQLALSYVDRQELFANIRFQVSLGAYRHRFYDKQGVDQKERVRILQKELHGFGRLQEIEERRKKEWETLIRPFEQTAKDHAGTEPYITDTHAQYMISNNRVGMYWDINEDANTGDYMPELNVNGAGNQAPVCWLSIYELPAMIFHSLLYRGQGHDTQRIIRDYVKQYRELFSDIREGKLSPAPEIARTVKERYALDFSRLPDEIRAYLSGESKDMDDRFIKLAETRIDRMIKDTQGRKRKIEVNRATIQDIKKNRVGKKRYVEIKPGILASFLAEDLLRFQPTQEAGKDKLTGINYRALQSTLALYNGHKAGMKQLFTSCKLLDSPIAHPFLDRVMTGTHPDIAGFYHSYLKERERYLNQCLKEKDYRNYHFLHAGRDKWQQRTPGYYRELAGKYMELPVELPRGLFNGDIKNLLDARYGHLPEIKIALSQDRCNTVYLVQTYFKAALGDERQAFYDFPRSYKLFDTLDNNFVRNKLQRRFYTTGDFEAKLKYPDAGIEKYIEKYQKNDSRKKLKRQLNDYDKNEKVLRLTQVQDMLLFLMAKRILVENQLPGTGDAKLKDIRPDNPEDILSTQTAFRLPVKSNDGTCRIIRQERLKLKHFGDFYRFICDRRVETLLPHLPGGETDRVALEEELEAYDRVRVKIFELIHRFEKRVMAEKSIQTPSPGFVEILQHCPGIDRDTKQQMQIIRNAFIHNTYPARRERIRDVESAGDTTFVEVEFDLAGVSVPGVANHLGERFERLINNNL
jgi:hypothetical protein